ncbi:MAG: hypothetical protein IT305_18350 [Chloroflexi bacterium]|nr:hypothetical protein [Chloroflexota bacterium]
MSNHDDLTPTSNRAGEPDTEALRTQAEAAQRRVTELTRAVETLRIALIGVAERQLPNDPLPCFCVRYESGPHDEWCEDARQALAATSEGAPLSYPESATAHRDQTA